MPMVTMNRFNHWTLVHAIEDAEMEPWQLAEQMGASVEAVARWMAGIAEPRPVYANAAARILNINVDDLYGDEPEE